MLKQLSLLSARTRVAIVSAIRADKGEGEFEGSLQPEARRRSSLVGFLGGVEGPTIQQDNQEIGTLGIALQTFLDFGVSLGDVKASHRMAGV